MPTVVLLQGVAVELSGGHRLFRASPPLNVTLDLYNQSLVDAGIIGVVDPDVPGPPVPAYDELVAVHVGSGGSIPTGSSPVRQSDGTWAPLVGSTGSSTRLFVGPEDDIQPLIDGLTAGTEYVWTETDGAGTIINAWAEVA